MALIAVDTGEVLLLQYMLNKISATDVSMHLYSDPSTAPTDGTELGDLTEVSDPNYTTFVLAGSSWDVGTTGAGVTTASFAPQEFSFASAASVYGYYITDNTSTNLLMIERFDAAPFNIPSGGGTITVTPNITLD